MALLWRALWEREGASVPGAINCLLLALTSLLLSCGGGGGASQAPEPPPGNATTSIFSPVSASVNFSYYRDGSVNNPVSYIHVRDIDGDGIDEIFFVAFETAPNTAAQYSNTSVQILGWEAGVFKNLTSKWLPGTLNEVEGVGDLCFGDFNGDGKVDVFLAAYTDIEHPVQPYALMNQGTSFTKVAFPQQTWMHAVTCADINQDGFDDVLVTGYSGFPQYLGSAGGLIEYQGMVGGSGIAAGDFLGDGKVQAVIVDAGGAPRDSRLYSLTINDVNQSLGFHLIADLPGPRLDNQLADPANPNSSHDVRVRAVDFNRDGKLDVVVFSYRYNSPDTHIAQRSEIQFLQNQGAGQFVDVTESVRIGFDTSGNVGYSPLFRDFNGDGLVDLIVSQPDWLLAGYKSTSLLMQSVAGKFVDTAKNELNGLIESGGGQATIARGPGGVFYLVKEAAWRRDGLTRVSIHAIRF